jgi:nitrile hydratase accessory protein
VSDAPAFSAPWEAQAFAMAVALQERGHVTAAEWAAALGDAGARAAAAGGSADSSSERWLEALEALVVGRGLADAGTLERYRDGWARAAARTPHGEPIELSTEDLG